MIDDANTIYVRDDSPNAEPRYRVRFYFDPNSISMASGNTHFIFKGFMGTTTEVLRMEFRQSSGAYQLRASLLNDSSTGLTPAGLPLAIQPTLSSLTGGLRLLRARTMVV